KWFNNQVDTALTSSVKLIEDYHSMVRNELSEHSEFIAQVILSNQLFNYSQKKSLTNILDLYVQSNLATGLQVYNKKGKSIFYKDLSDKNYLKLLSEKHLDNIIKGKTETGYDFFDGTYIYWIGLPIAVNNDKAKIQGVLFSYKAIPQKIADDIIIIQDSREKYRESEFFSYPVKKSYFMLLVMMSLLVIFVGIWGSIFFARKITKPIEALADASVEISKGNLDVEVTERGGDEISYLIRTFNHMVKLINMHNKELHSKNEALSEMYNQISMDNMYIDAILRNVDAAILLLSYDMKILKANSRADILLSHNKEQIDDVIKDDMEGFVSSEETEFFKNTELTVNDEKRLFSISVSKISSDGNDHQMLLVITDITDIVNAQRISLWKEVATRIAHEVKNPLTPIKLLAERVKKRSFDLSEIDTKRIIQESMDTIVTETDNLLELVEDFNLFARLPKTKKYPVEISGLVKGVLSLYTDTYPNIEFVYSGEEGVFINGDTLQIRRVIQNLVSNAISAIEQSGQITIEVNSSNNNTVEIHVKDTGTGIKPNDISKIFDPYFSKRSGGTGLGLAIVKKIIEEHSGSIDVESSSKGKNFTIVLPRGDD
ncbi:MAG: HAMP domain-containing protein, partial [Deferribacterales bacterium]|nr:HAMP domain-containing protein [Deferribacterales bacterium]